MQVTSLSTYMTDCCSSVAQFLLLMAFRAYRSSSMYLTCRQVLFIQRIRTRQLPSIHRYLSSQDYRLGDFGRTIETDYAVIRAKYREQPSLPKPLKILLRIARNSQESHRPRTWAAGIRRVASCWEASARSALLAWHHRGPDGKRYRGYHGFSASVSVH